MIDLNPDSLSSTERLSVFQLLVFVQQLYSFWLTLSPLSSTLLSGAARGPDKPAALAPNDRQITLGTSC